MLNELAVEAVRSRKEQITDEGCGELETRT
jgi:hypothetical protein